jgi:hypothetical protein
MIANSRGFQYLAGAASLKYRMPAIVDAFPPLDVAQMVEQQLDTLSVAGSNPALQSWCFEKHRPITQ